MKTNLNLTENILNMVYKEKIEKYKKKLKSYSDRNKCQICLERHKKIIFIPCFHYGVCKQCSENLTKCPFCNLEILSKNKVYQP